MTNKFEEMDNLRILVDVVLKRIEEEAKQGDFSTIAELLWHVPTQILATYVKKA